LHTGANSRIPSSRTESYANLRPNFCAVTSLWSTPIPRQQRSARLQSREARLKLTPRHEPYWHEVERGRSLGYRPGAKGGSWRIRERVGDLYRQRSLGRADDVNDADGRKILSFSQAVRLVLDEDRPTLKPHADLTVDEALEDYFEGKKVRSSSGTLLRERTAAESLIIPVLGGRRVSELSEDERHRLKHSLHGKRVSELTTADLRRWRDSRVPTTDDRELRRRAQATANRVWTLLRAALNLAFQNERTPTDQAWRRIKPFKNVDRPQTRFLTAEDCRNLIRSAQPDFANLIRACLLTGMRLGELVILKVSDVGPDHVTIRHGKTGLARRVPVNSEGARFFEEMTTKRPPGDAVLLQADGTPWTPMRVSRGLRLACKEADIEPPIQFRQLRTTYGSLLLNADAPLSTISELLGHKDTRMTRRHYAHLLSEKLKETVDDKLPSFS
jgi:integrase